MFPFHLPFPLSPPFLSAPFPCPSLSSTPTTEQQTANSLLSLCYELIGRLIQPQWASWPAHCRQAGRGSMAGNVSPISPQQQGTSCLVSMWGGQHWGWLAGEGSTGVGWHGRAALRWVGRGGQHWGGLAWEGSTEVGWHGRAALRWVGRGGQH